MFTALFGSVELGIIYAIMALGVYLTFRVLDFPDMTVDGSFVTGAGTAAMMIVLGYHPVLATLTAMVAGIYCRMYDWRFTYKRKNKSAFSRDFNA